MPETAILSLRSVLASSPSQRRACQRSWRCRRIQQGGRRRGSGMPAPEHSSNPAVDELIKPHSLAARRVECFARYPAGRPGDDGAKIRLLDKYVHVDTLDQLVDVDTIKHTAHIGRPEHHVEIP